MLFSREDLAQFINANFEPTWENVRPVPILRIDFGNGNVVTRTLNGNIATYACTAEGEVLDILPGIYEPATYLHQLNQLRLLANYVDQEGKARRGERLRQYHEVQATARKQNETPVSFVDMMDLSKARVENRVKAILVGPGKTPPAPPRQETPNGGSPEDVAAWKSLAEDTAHNEKVRRWQIHSMLAKASPVEPSRVTKPLYKDVLNADLDDPYLGLGKTLFANYPFAQEERRSSEGRK